MHPFPPYFLPFRILGLGHMDPFETWSLVLHCLLPYHLAPHILSLFLASTNITLPFLHVPYLDSPLSLVPIHSMPRLSNQFILSILSYIYFYPFISINSFLSILSILFIHSYHIQSKSSNPFNQFIYPLILIISPLLIISFQSFYLDQISSLPFNTFSSIKHLSLALSRIPLPFQFNSSIILSYLIQILLFIS